MKNIILMAVLGLASPICLAGWIALAADQVATEYVNLETLERSEKSENPDHFVKMWNMSDFKTLQEVGNGKLFKSSKALQEYDCAHDKKRLISLIHYAENMGQGPVAYLDSTVDQWRVVTPGSLGEVHFKAACSASK